MRSVVKKIFYYGLVRFIFVICLLAGINSCFLQQLGEQLGLIEEQEEDNLITLLGFAAAGSQLRIPAYTFRTGIRKNFDATTLNNINGTWSVSANPNLPPDPRGASGTFSIVKNTGGSVIGDENRLFYWSDPNFEYNVLGTGDDGFQYDLSLNLEYPATAPLSPDHSVQSNCTFPNSPTGWGSNGCYGNVEFLGSCAPYYDSFDKNSVNYTGKLDSCTSAWSYVCKRNIVSPVNDSNLDKICTALDTFSGSNNREKCQVCSLYVSIPTGPGACGIFLHSFASNDIQSISLCQGAYAYQCSGNINAREATCQQLNNLWAGSGGTTACSYCI